MQRSVAEEGQKAEDVEGSIKRFQEGGLQLSSERYSQRRYRIESRSTTSSQLTLFRTFIPNVRGSSEKSYSGRV